MIADEIRALERNIVQTLGYEVHALIEAARDPHPTLAFDARVVSLNALIGDVLKLKRLCEDRAGVPRANAPETDEERAERHHRAELGMARLGASRGMSTP